MEAQEIMAKRDMSSEEVEEIKECHPEGLVDCYCDNTHEQNHTVCMFCYIVQKLELEA